jgi:hypothetical protein
MVLTFRHLGHHFLRPGNFVDISIIEVPSFVQSAGLLNANTKGYIKDRKRSLCNSHYGACPTVF